MNTRQSGIRLAKRLDEVGFSGIVQVRNKVMAMRAEGLHVHSLHCGEPFFETPQEIKYAAVKALVENHTHYAPSSGLPPLRQALAAKLAVKNAIHVTEDEVIATVGGSQGLYAAFQSVIDPGDHVLVFSPYWTPIGDLVTLAQGRPLLVPTITARRNGIRKTLEQFSTPHTRAIYFNTPQNPSGLVFTRAEAEEVAAFAIERDLVVIADEAYEDLVYDGVHFSIAALPGMAERTITSFTFSKTYAMTGWRMGYGVMPTWLVEAVTKLMVNSNSCTASFTQRAGLAALTGPQDCVTAMVAEFRRRRDAICAGLNQVPGFRCPVPGGAFYVFANIEGTGMDSKELADYLLYEAGVSCLDGGCFGEYGKGYIRFSYANSMANLMEAVDRIRKASPKWEASLVASR
jgi:aspartate aminotransferase